MVSRWSIGSCALLLASQVGAQQLGSLVQVSQTGPPVSAYGSMIFDSARGRTLLIPGLTGASVDRTNWEWDGATWQAVSSSGLSATYAASMAFDSQRGRVIRFGGWAGGNVT